MSDAVDQSKHETLRVSLRALPAVDELLRTDAIKRCGTGLPPPLVARAVRAAVADVRTRIINEAVCDEGAERSGVNLGAADRDPAADAEHSISGLAEREALRHIDGLRRSLLGRVVNATGVILHTNLGRAPLSPRALQAVEHVARGYSNLEYDALTGRRGLRDLHGETLLTVLTDAEAALVVNNNAAAVLLVLTALARGREVILSRGEMIEIGGAFRIPEVMEQSGCLLREVGTTNRTHLHDYEAALGEETGAILKVHPSNYKISGFTSEVDAGALVPLARRRGVPLIADVGSGVLAPMPTPYGPTAEPTVQSRIAAGIDIVTFSGDKLLGGPQAGIIVGRKALVDVCRRHPLARALRVGKMTLAALQATLLEYLNDEHERIPIYEMMGVPIVALRTRATALRDQIDSFRGPSPLEVSIVDTDSTVGGGSLPGETMPSVAVGICSDALGPDRLAAALRRAEPPIIGRVEEDAVLLDLRTVAPTDDRLLVEAVVNIIRHGLPTGGP